MSVRETERAIRKDSVRRDNTVKTVERREYIPVLKYLQIVLTNHTPGNIIVYNNTRLGKILAKTHGW